MSGFHPLTAALPPEAGTRAWISVWLTLGALVALLSSFSLRLLARARRRSPGAHSHKLVARPEASPPEEDDESEDESDDDAEPCKMVLCVRQDLNMGKGKIAAQCGHATLGAYQRAQRRNDRFLDAWTACGQKKIAVKIKDHDEMKSLSKAAKEKGLNAYAVCDAGRTQVPAGSYTVLAIGPGPEDLIDEVTGHLKLL